MAPGDHVGMGQGAALCAVLPSHRLPGTRLKEGLGLTEADADWGAFPGPVVRLGDHAAVDALILGPHLREQQHRAGRQGQAHALAEQGW